MKQPFKDWLKIWKAWLGILLIGIGLDFAIKYSDYWMLILVAVGILLCIFDRKNVRENESSTLIITLTIVVLLMSIIQDSASQYF